VNISDFHFDLPAELVAQDPAVDRGGARLLHLSRATGLLTHTAVSALPRLLQTGDLLVVNNTRVFPARLLGHRVPSGGAVECLLLSPFVSDTLTPLRQLSDASPTPLQPPAAAEQKWEALVHPGQKLKPGSRVVFTGARTLHAEILERRFAGRRWLRLWTEDGSSVDEAVDAIGHVPLPPYIKRPDRRADQERYQTVFASQRGSVAAPTAGLHFSQPLLDELTERGVQTAEVTLHIGYGTFQPVRVAEIEQHRMESERYHISDEAATAINEAIDQHRRVIAVGTTTTRTLEASARDHAGVVAAGWGATNLFIYPGFRFQVIQGLLSNFHLPESSLLLLVSAFAGRERLLAAYHQAIAERYRFYSYGDAMLIL
jgi:S-adenosylmethionine:tRNA ribosyltransferase-isomerase